MSTNSARRLGRTVVEYDPEDERAIALEVLPQSIQVLAMLLICRLG
jgi:hypothetical protein